jgi:Plavaka transposase
VCEVYFRDVIACLRALFGNPDFAPILVFAPEKHYTDELRTARLYHDMHTGRWWWSTQVRSFNQYHYFEISRMSLFFRKRLRKIFPAQLYCQLLYRATKLNLQTFAIKVLIRCTLPLVTFQKKFDVNLQTVHMYSLHTCPPPDLKM